MWFLTKDKHPPLDVMVEVICEDNSTLTLKHSKLAFAPLWCHEDGSVYTGSSVCKWRLHVTDAEGFDLEIGDVVAHALPFGSGRIARAKITDLVILDAKTFYIGLSQGDAMAYNGVARSLLRVCGNI